MPRLKRRTKQRRTGWTAAHIRQLETGHEFFNDAFGRHDRGTLDVDAMRQAWDELRDELLTRWVAEKPSTRPWAWWAFDAPEPRRRRIDGNGPHPFDNADRAAWLVEHGIAGEPADHLHGAYRLDFGLPGVLCGPQDFDGRIVFESETDYVGRYRLMTDAEREQLGGQSSKVRHGGMKRA